MNEQIELNEHHQRRLLVSCQYMDRLLADIESVMTSGASLSPFPKYIQDLSEREKGLTTKLVATLRRQLLEMLIARGVDVPGPTISSRHSILTCLGYIAIALEELKPRYLKGYGPVPQSIAPDLHRSVEDLQATVRATISELKAQQNRPTAGSR
jgi:hypothetical protein